MERIPQNLKSGNPCLVVFEKDLPARPTLYRYLQSAGARESYLAASLPAESFDRLLTAREINTLAKCKRWFRERHPAIPRLRLNRCVADFWSQYLMWQDSELARLRGAYVTKSLPMTRAH